MLTKRFALLLPRCFSDASQRLVAAPCSGAVSGDVASSSPCDDSTSLCAPITFFSFKETQAVTKQIFGRMSFASVEDNVIGYFSLKQNSPSGAIQDFLKRKRNCTVTPSLISLLLHYSAVPSGFCSLSASLLFLFNNSVCVLLV